MTTGLLVLFFIAALGPLALAGFGKFKGKRTKKALLFANLALVLILVIGCLGSVLAAPAGTDGHVEQDPNIDLPVQAEADSSTANVSIGAGLGMLAAALVTGIACIGAGIAVASSASAAIGALSENSSVFGKSMIFVALAEGVALYGMLISIQILNLL